MLEVDQIFVEADSREAVEAELKRAMTLWGFFAVDEHLPLYDRVTEPSAKPIRHFYVSIPIGGWVCVLESLGGDRAVASKLSKVINSRSIWLSFSGLLEELSFTEYERGEVTRDETYRPQRRSSTRILSFTGSRKRSAGERQLIEKAKSFFERKQLPWPLYSYEQIDASPNKNDYFSHLNFKKGRD